MKGDTLLKYVVDSEKERGRFPVGDCVDFMSNSRVSSQWGLITHIFNKISDVQYFPKKNDFVEKK